MPTMTKTINGLLDHMQKELDQKINPKSESFESPISNMPKALDFCMTRKPKASPLDDDYLFSEKAKRALFFAKYNASIRDTDSCTHHITIEDLVKGIKRETRKSSSKQKSKGKTKL